MNKVLDFFNKITGLLIFGIFLLLLMEHLHHAHFRNRDRHPHFKVRANPGDTAGTITDSSGKK